MTLRNLGFRRPEGPWVGGAAPAFVPIQCVMARALWLVMIVVAGCSSGGGAETPDADGASDAAIPPVDGANPGTSSPDAAGPGPAVDARGAGTPGDAGGGTLDDAAAREAFFRNDVVHRVEITVDTAAWAAFMELHRSFGLKPMNVWFKADFQIDGTTTLRDVGFHSFGWGSRDLNKDKPNLSLDIDHNVAGQSLHGIKRIRIKNNGQDQSGLRQALIYQAMREDHLLAPRSTFAELTVNGQPYGYYFVEETFTEGFVRERTGNSNGAAYEAVGCQGLVSPMEGGCDKMPIWFTRPFNETVGEGEDLVALCQVMNGPPEQFLSGLAPLIIVSEWIDQVAIDTALAGDLDGFSVTGSNFRLYHDTSMNKLRLLVLGPDNTFVPEMLPAPSFTQPEPDVGCVGENPQFRDIFLEKLMATPEGQALYQQAVRRLRTSVFTEATVNQRVDAWWSVVGPHAVADPLTAAWADVNESKDTIKQFVSRRWPALQQAGY